VALRGEPVVAATRAAGIERRVRVLPRRLEQAEGLEASQGPVDRRTVERGAGGLGIEPGSGPGHATGVVAEEERGELEGEAVAVRGTLLARPGMDGLEDVRLQH
jgi:hypothetical protein